MSTHFPSPFGASFSGMTFLVAPNKLVKCRRPIAFRLTFFRGKKLKTFLSLAFGGHIPNNCDGHGQGARPHNTAQASAIPFSKCSDTNNKYGHLNGLRSE